MATSCDRRGAAALAIAVLVVGLAATPTRATAEPACQTMTTASLLDVHFGIEPAPHDRLGLDLRVRGLRFGWGGGCDGRRHQLELSDAEAPDYGDRHSAVIRLVSYRHGWEGDDWTAHVGLHGFVNWGDAWRFATPMVGGSLRIGRALLRGELDLGGLSLLDPDLRIDHRRTDLAFDGSLVWPAEAASRLEVRLRTRDLAMPGGTDDVHDVTVTAGVGWTLAARDHVRAVPGFIGVAGRAAADRAALLVFEWSMGVGSD